MPTEYGRHSESAAGPRFDRTVLANRHPRSPMPAGLAEQSRRGASADYVLILPLLAADLAALAEALHEAESDLADELKQLLRTSQGAVPSCQGLSITITSRGQAVVFTLLEDGVGPRHIRTSILLPLPLFTATEEGSSLVLFGTRPGAFVDFAADLSVATVLPLARFVLDAHVALAARAGERTGLAELAIVNQAIGILIEGGLTLEAAVKQLRTLSVANAESTHAVAARIVDDLHAAPDS